MASGWVVSALVVGLPIYLRLPSHIRSALMLCVVVPYLICLAVVLAAEPMEARLLVKQYMDSSLGVPVPEKVYGDDCMTWDAVVQMMDLFVIAHTFGWLCSTVVMRNWKLAFLMSVVDEVVEFTFACHHPNFAECWWDHLFDVVCNLVGALAGAWLCVALGRNLVHWFSGTLSHVEKAMAVAHILVTRIFLFLCIFGVRWALWIPDSHPFNVLHPFMYLLLVERVVEEHFVPPTQGGWRVRWWLLLCSSGCFMGMGLIVKHGYFGQCMLEQPLVVVAIAVTVLTAGLTVVFLVVSRACQPSVIEDCDMDAVRALRLRKHAATKAAAAAGVPALGSETNGVCHGSDSDSDSDGSSDSSDGESMSYPQRNGGRTTPANGVGMRLRSRHV